MIKARIEKALQIAVLRSFGETVAPELLSAEMVERLISVERPRNNEHGEYSCSSAFRLQQIAALAPLQIAEKLFSGFPEESQSYFQAEIHPTGFINFRLKDRALKEELSRIFAVVRLDLKGLSEQASCSFVCGEVARENREFLIQYVHARCCSLLRQAFDPLLNLHTLCEEPARLSRQKWSEWLATYSSDPLAFDKIFDRDSHINQCQRQVVLLLSLFDEEPEKSRLKRKRSALLNYSAELASKVDELCAASLVFYEDESVTRARLGLIESARMMLKRLLFKLELQAPERA